MKGEKGMKNINKNAVQALWLDGKAYLAHKAIDGFMMGQGEFTIETTFICNDVNDCLIYAQEQGFEFGIRDKHLYFEMEGVGSITQEGVSVDTDIMFFAAVTCREGKLALYFEGLPAADAIDVKLEATGNSGNYVIGKGLNGYIVDLRLRSCGMEDQEILLENGAGLKECDSVEFWGDFTTVQYRDKSHNALSLWTEQGIVKCMNVTSCTKLSMRGGFATVSSNSYDSGYTLLFKVYPQVENTQKMYIYSAVSENRNAVFSIGIEPDDKGDSYAFVEHNGETYHCETILPLAEWVDIGLRIEGADAALYVDGVKRLTFTFEGELSNITGIIGIKPFQNKISYKNSFWGYLDYFAEFECALDEGKIAFYAEEQPYIFDESIRTLYAFFCGEPIDLVSGSTLLLAGQSRPVFEKNLNSMTAPIGMDFRVPQEVCAEWQELDEYEQWATTTAMDMVRETYSLSMGLIAAEGTLPIEQTATKQIRELYAEQIEEVKLVWTPENENVYTRSFIKGAFPVAVGGVGTAVVGGMASLAFKAFLGSKALKLIGLSLFVGGGIVIVAGGVRAKEKTNSKKRPENKKGKLQLVSICCNHNGNPKEGSIHFHSDAVLTQPESMTYMNPSYLSNGANNVEMSMDMLLIMDELGGKKVKATIKVINNDKAKTFEGVLIVCGSIVFGEKQSGIIQINPSDIKEVELCLPIKKELEGIACYIDDTLTFQYLENGTTNKIYMRTCHVGIYMQQTLPIAPWILNQGQSYDVGQKNYPSLVFMRNMITDCCNGVQKMENMEAFNKILNNLYSSEKLRYSAAAGRLVNNFNEFDLVTFNTDIENENQVSKTAIDVNCTVCANIVCLIAAQVGIDMKMNIIWGVQVGEKVGFTTKYVLGMPDDNPWLPGEFSYHQVAFLNKDNRFDKNSEIYDLALKIDESNNPGSEDPKGKKGFLSGGYMAYENNDIYIHTTNNYTGKYYLERLVKDGQCASFIAKILDTNIKGIKIQPNELYATLMQQYIQSYGLNDEKYADEIPQPEVQSALLQEMGLESTTQMQYEYVWSAPNNKEVTWFCNVEHLSAGEYLASVLMRYSCRLTEKDSPELGERVFYGPDLLITYFAGNAYAIRCKDMEEAEETARRLKDSKNQQTI